MISKILSKAFKAFKQPKKIWPYITARFKEEVLILRRKQIRKVIVNGKVFYEYRHELYPDYLLGGNAARFILDKAKVYCRGKGVDVGSGKWPFPGAVPIDDEIQQSAYKLDHFEDRSLDYIFSSHCLEHLNRWQEALSLWVSKIKKAGILFLYLPHRSMKLWLPGGLWVFDDHKWSPTYEIVNKFLEDHGMEIIDYDPWRDKYWSFYIVARKMD